jgi:hypothetical protein
MLVINFPILKECDNRPKDRPINGIIKGDGVTGRYF